MYMSILKKIVNTGRVNFMSQFYFVVTVTHCVSSQYLPFPGKNIQTIMLDNKVILSNTTLFLGR